MEDADEAWWSSLMAGVGQVEVMSLKLKSKSMLKCPAKSDDGWINAGAS